MKNMKLGATLLVLIAMTLATACSEDINNPTARDTKSEFLAKYSNEDVTGAQVVMRQNGDLIWTLRLNANCVLMARGNIESVILHPGTDHYIVSYIYDEPGLTNMRTSERCAPGTEIHCAAEKAECDRALSDSAERFMLNEGRGSKLIPVEDGHDQLTFRY
jgi:hypothetical protein